MGMYMPQCIYVCRPGDILTESVLSFHHVSPEDGTQVGRLEVETFSHWVIREYFKFILVAINPGKKKRADKRIIGFTGVSYKLTPEWERQIIEL